MPPLSTRQGPPAANRMSQSPSLQRCECHAYVQLNAIRLLLHCLRRLVSRLGRLSRRSLTSSGSSLRRRRTLSGSALRGRGCSELVRPLRLYPLKRTVDLALEVVRVRGALLGLGSAASLLRSERGSLGRSWCGLGRRGRRAVGLEDGLVLLGVSASGEGEEGGREEAERLPRCWWSARPRPG